MENYHQAHNNNNNQNHQNYNPNYTQPYSQQQAYNHFQNAQSQQPPQFFVPQQPFVPSTFVPPAPPPQHHHSSQNDFQNFTVNLFFNSNFLIYDN